MGPAAGVSVRLSAASSLTLALIAASYQGTRHPTPLQLESFRSCDAMLLTEISTTVVSPEVSLLKLVVNIQNTLRQGGHVLLPSSLSSTLLDVMEFVFAHLDKIGLGGTKMYVVSPLAKQFLQYGSIVSEWLSESKQQNAYEAREPFVYGQLIEQGRLIVLDDLQEVRSQTVSRLGAQRKSFAFEPGKHGPCIVVATHPSLRFGPALQCLLDWGSNPRHSMLLTDPSFQSSVVLNASLRALFDTPHGNELAIRTVNCPIDPRLSSTDAMDLIKSVEPKHVLFGQHSPLNRLVKNGRLGAYSATVLRPTEPMALPLSMEFLPSSMSAQLAKSVKLKRLNPTSDLAAASFRAALVGRDDDVCLKSVSDAQKHSPPKSLWGTPSADRLLLSLQANGINDAVLKEGKGTRRLEIPSLSAHVYLSPDETKVVTNDGASRRLLSAVLLQNLTML